MVLIVDTLFTPPLSASASGSSGYSSYQFEPSPNYTQSDIKALLKISGDSSGLPKIQVEWKTPQGTTADCHPQGGGCTTYNEYSANGGLISVTWEFFISGQQRPSGTYTAIVNYCTNLIPYNTCIGWAEMFRANFYINDYRIYLPLVIR
jgi:hypothetical protein